MATRHLITGATGATGGEVVRLLLDAGASVRALAHREDERSRELQRRGAEVVYGDFLDFDAVRSALAGVNCAYFCYPISPGIAQATAQFAQAAKEAGVAFIVNMSQKSARGDAKSEAARQHWLSERVFDWSGVPVAHLRPTYFAEWLLYLAPMIRQGLMLAPFSTTGRHAPIAAEDQARVIVGMFAKPDAHAGKTYRSSGRSNSRIRKSPKSSVAFSKRKLNTSKSQWKSSWRFSARKRRSSRTRPPRCTAIRQARAGGQTTSLSICTRSRSITQTASSPAPTVTSLRLVAGPR